MNDAVEMTTNKLQQNISIKLADDYLRTLLTWNVMKFPVDLAKIFNSVALGWLYDDLTQIEYSRIINATCIYKV